MEDRNRKHHIWYLLSQEYPRWCIEESDWTPDTVPLIQADADQQDSAEYREARDHYDELSKLSEEALADCIEALRVDREKAKIAERETRHPLNSEMTKATAETYDFYAKLEYWEDAEVVALLLGRNPKVLIPTRVRARQPYAEILRRYSEVSELLMRAKATRHLRLLKPGYVLGWARKIGLDVPQELEEAIVGYGRDIIDPADKLAGRQPFRKAKSTALARARTDTEKPLGTKESESLLKLVIGMAVGGYRYDPKMQRNATTKDIADDLEEAGVALDRDTILKWLREAGELLPSTND